jgi:perosamine synthetase
MPRKQIHFGRPMIGPEEREAVLEVLSSPQLVHGPRAKAFERGFAARLGPEAHATSVSSCTAGLHLAYMHLGIGAGDEVIVPAETHVATAHAVEITGAKPVFVDGDRTGNIDLEGLARAITPRTKAISVVHFLGLPVDMAAVMKIARAHGIFVVEDCALAVGASIDGTACGLWGDVGVFSFYPVKHMTTAEGGMVVSRHADVVASIDNLKAFGYDRMLGERKIAGVYDVVRLGLNYRMNEIEAAIGLAQLDKLDAFQARRNENAAALRQALAKQSAALDVLADGNNRQVHSHYCVSIVLKGALAPRRSDIIDMLKARDIGVSVYYPVPVPLSKYYREKYQWQDRDFPNASRISHHSIALPVGPHLEPEDMTVIADGLADVIQECTSNVH